MYVCMFINLYICMLVCMYIFIGIGAHMAGTVSPHATTAHTQTHISNFNPYIHTSDNEKYLHTYIYMYIYAYIICERVKLSLPHSRSRYLMRALYSICCHLFSVTSVNAAARLSPFACRLHAAHPTLALFVGFLLSIHIHI